MNYRVIKENDLFLLTDEYGNIPENHFYGLGLYTKDTRFLSKFDFVINGEMPILLSSKVVNNYIVDVRLTNPDIEESDKTILARDSIEITRKRFIQDGALYEVINAKNLFPTSINFNLTFTLDADFQDMFIVRGFQTGNTGKKLPNQVTKNQLVFSYFGADDIKRSTIIAWNKKPQHTTSTGDIIYNISLGQGEEESICLKIIPVFGDKLTVDDKRIEPNVALEKLETSYKEWKDNSPSIHTDNKLFNRLIDRGLNDLRALLTDVGFGKFPVAGLPWFGVPFGRDSLIAAFQMLPFHPEVAKGTLLTMAHYQGTKEDSWRDEQPGKIMHEIRYGELANTNQIPYNPYYGSIDATPLFLILLVEYVKWTGDFELFFELENNVSRALKWIDAYGDRDGDYFVEYHQESEKGFPNQGWKDSEDSIVHDNGELASSPIALSEVQGYVYQAKIGISEIYDSLGKVMKTSTLRQEAEILKEKFHQAFWMDDKEYFAIALDAKKRKVETITSNPGHLLLSGILKESYASKVTTMLTSNKMFSGYGIRTMGEGESAYDPSSYHNGSIWAHDNSLILLGMSKLGFFKQANLVISGLIKASQYFEYNRLPELFCGHSIEEGEPVKYPVACSPQAWSSGTGFLMVQSILGLFPNALDKTISLNPVLPSEINTFKAERIKIGKGYLSAIIEKNGVTPIIKILENTTGFEVI